MTSGARPSLTDRQIEQIIRYKAGGMAYKEVARRVACSPDQAIHYWRTSSRYKPQPQRAASAKRREAIKAAAMREQLRIVIARQETDLAMQALRREIGLAVGEATQTPPFKPGPLEW